MLRAHVLRRVAHGERYLVERTLLSDGRVIQRVNEGVPVDEGPWREVGRYDDLAAERVRLRGEGWEIDES